MGQIENNKFKYTQKDAIIGDKKRDIIIVDKKLGSSVSPIKKRTVSVRKKGCSGCSRRRG